MLRKFGSCVLLLLVVSCNAPDQVAPAVIDPELVIDDSAELPVSADDFAQGLTFDPKSTRYFDLINATMPLNDEELALFAQNGFVVTDRLNWTRFVEAYAWIYKNDLPVVITSDSILHTVHQSYSNLLQQFEVNIIYPELVTMLNETRNQVLEDKANVTDSTLAALYDDVYDYLTVAIVLTEGQALDIQWGSKERYNPEKHGIYPSDVQLTLNLDYLSHHDSERINELVTLAWEANSVTKLTLFHNLRSIDFTLFQPRAHYNNTLLLANYFRGVNNRP
jgi:hypothetical protein